MKADLEQLIDNYVDGSISAEEMRRLNACLRDDGEARKKFADSLNLDSALGAAAAAWDLESSEPGHRSQPSGPVINFPSPAQWLALAACLMLFLGGGWWWQQQSVFARVQSGAGVAELADGARLGGKSYEITTGSLELITQRGARVVIEAPAAFRFESAQRLHLQYGRIAADVPPAAVGFTVVTATGEAVDLGTKFGVDAPLEGEAEIHVFEGEVIAQSSGGKKQSLRDGEAFSLHSGAGQSRELRSSAFIRPNEVASLHAALDAGQQARSDTAMTKLRQDPALIALLDFENGNGEDLPQGSYRMVQGRWPGSRAPEFVNVHDHMKLDVGGNRAWQQLTLVAWVRLDRLGEPYQSLLHTDGWSKNKSGQVHWMVTKHTTMRLALFGNTLPPDSREHEGHPDSLTSVLPEKGRWVHLAAVYDAQKHNVRFYLNGKFDSETHQVIAHPAKLGPAQIGNWDQNDRKLSGRVDELLLLGRAMSDGEVQALFAAGNPYR
ncbi:MAG: FecR domain-containing protein [Verrucomicrobiota bacterium]